MDATPYSPWLFHPCNAVAWHTICPSVVAQKLSQKLAKFGTKKNFQTGKKSVDNGVSNWYLTYMDKRKHYSQMTQDEMAIVLGAVKSITKVQTTPYIRSRMQERAITNLHIALTLTQGSPVEVHNNNAREIRVLMRGLVDNKWCNVVVSLTTKTVITCFWNALNDTHKTLDKSQYKWAVDLTTVLV